MDTGQSKLTAGKILGRIAIVVFVFPVLFSALLTLYKPLLMLSKSAGLHSVVIMIESVIGLLLAIVGSIWMCRKIWPRRE